MTTDTHIQCPCCGTPFSKVDAPQEYARVRHWSPAREMARLMHAKAKLDPQTKAKRRAVLARNRAKRWPILPKGVDANEPAL